MNAADVKTVLVDVMDSLDYQRVVDDSFRARWSSRDVEHYLYWRVSRNETFLMGEFGLRNPVSEQYAQDCAVLYGGWPRKDLRLRYEQHSCFMRLTFDRLDLDSKELMIMFTRMTDSELRSQLLEIVESKVLPALSPIASFNDLYSTLEADGRLCPWFATNAVLRAAKLAKLGKMLGMPTEALESTLLQHQAVIQKFIRSDQNVQVYIQKIISHENDAGPH
jgi:hypothetical protein